MSNECESPSEPRLGVLRFETQKSVPFRRALRPRRRPHLQLHDRQPTARSGTACGRSVPRALTLS